MFFKKVRILFILIFLLLPLTANSETYGKNQLIPAEHWIYDALYMIYNDSASVFVMDSAPLSVQEIRLFLNAIEYESLSDSCKRLYDRINEFLDKKKWTFDFEPVKVGFNFNFHPSVAAKTNKEIDWSFATDYAENSEGYGAGSDFYENLPHFCPMF